MSKLLLPLLILSLVAGCIEVDISAPGFPAMATYFQVSEGVIQLTIAYNFLGFCLASLFYGPLSDALGRRRLMLWGNAGLALGALGCVWAPSIEWLLIARFIQGLGASASAVLAFAMIADVYPAERSSKLIAVMNSFLTVLMAIAPAIGGLVNQHFGFKGNYGIVAAVCVLSWLSLCIGLPETKQQLESVGWRKILDDYRNLARSPRFMLAALIPSLSVSAYMAFVACGPFLYINRLGLSVLAYAAHQASVVAIFSLTSLVVDKVTQCLGHRRTIVLSGLWCLVSVTYMLIQSLLWPQQPYGFTLGMILLGMGVAVNYPLVFTESLAIFPDIKGTASSAIMGMRALIIFLAVSLSGYIYNGDPWRVTGLLFVIIAVTVAVMQYWVKAHLPKSEPDFTAVPEPR